VTATTALADLLNEALPQTQCTRCGYPDCRTYSRAVAAADADINQCPPGGRQGIARLAAITGRPALALNPSNGVEGPRRLAVIDEAWCIGCTLCIKACPVDCIVGGPKLMHTVIDDACTGCELCIPVCPVDCIAMVSVSADKTGWDAWSPAQASDARKRYAFHQFRVERDKSEHDARLASNAKTKRANLGGESRISDPAEPDNKRTAIEAALARARSNSPR
jgi:Na+-translocating ferredoxin:NAD+ oxidoreductase subunit B